MKGVGLYPKYQIKKVVGQKIIGETFFGEPIKELVTKEVDSENEYFVLKVAGKGDKAHINACKKAVLTYANEIQNKLPELANDLKERYS